MHNWPPNWAAGANYGTGPLLQYWLIRDQYLAGTLGKEGRNGSKLGLARHFALALMGRARHQARKLFGG